MVLLNAIDIDATFVRISLWNLNISLLFRQARDTPFIQDFLVILKTLFTWPLARNAVCNMRDLPPLILPTRFRNHSMLTNKTTCEVAGGGHRALRYCGIRQFFMRYFRNFNFK